VGVRRLEFALTATHKPNLYNVNRCARERTSSSDS
jgi:hypothetical protein